MARIAGGTPLRVPATKDNHEERDKKWSRAGWIFFHNDGLPTSKCSSDNNSKGRGRLVVRGNDMTAKPDVAELSTPSLGPVIEVADSSSGPS
eukprot:15951418-Heterocapsa_arctica.AAC.1